MLDAVMLTNPTHNQGNRDRGHDDDHSGVPVGTRPAASLHRRAMVRTTETYITSSAVEMHAAESKAGVDIERVMMQNLLFAKINFCQHRSAHRLHIKFTLHIKIFLKKLILHRMHCIAWHGILYFYKIIEVPSRIKEKSTR
jgi:hypothetical protein